MDEIVRYLDNAEKKMKASSSSPPEVKGKAAYEYAQILASVGKYDDACVTFAEAFKSLKTLNQNIVYKTLFCSVGVQYATVLDYLGKFEQAESVFKDIMAIEPTGVHIGDYALFLHRRKRDFERAQQ
jgi:tetratricopeptide (TPR) repeat protein